MYSRAATFYRIESWVLGFQLVALLIPVLLVLAALGYIAWAALF